MPAIRPVRMKDRPLLSYQQSSYTSRSRALGAQTLAYRASNNRNSIASITTSNPLWARACLRVQNSRFTGWSPPLRGGGRGRGGAPSLRVKKGTGDDFRKRRVWESLPKKL